MQFYNVKKLFTGLTPLRCTPVYRGQARLIGLCQSKSSCPERLHGGLQFPRKAKLCQILCKGDF